MARRQAARAQGNPPDLSAEVATGAGAEADIAVAGIRLNDRVVAVINLTDGDNLTLASVGHQTVTVEENTTGDTLLVVYWSVGLGGNPSASSS